MQRDELAHVDRHARCSQRFRARTEVNFNQVELVSSAQVPDLVALQNAHAKAVVVKRYKFQVITPSDV
jgi:hypothetical protein